MPKRRKSTKSRKLPEIRDDVLREDLASFIASGFMQVNPTTDYLHNWHVEVIAEYLQACTRAEIRKLIINMPPRYLKSLCVSVAWPAWLLGNDPSRRILAASYAQGLSVKHSMDCRHLMASPWYKKLFPECRLKKEQNQKHKFMTTEQGYRLATSVGGTVTGDGGNFLIVDDPLSASDAGSRTKREGTINWFDQTFSSRLDDKEKGVFVLVMQRLHEEDLTGHLLARDSGWEHLCLPAIAEKRTVIDFGDVHRLREVGDLLHPEREGKRLIASIKKDLGSYGFAAQYQQSPIPQSGGMIKREWIHYYHAGPLEKKRIVQSWDTAIKTNITNDYSVCTIWGEAEHGYYLLDVMRRRMEYPELKRLIISLGEKWQPDAILIEDKASGQSVLQDLRRETTLPLIAIKPIKDKITRMASASALFEAGKIFVPGHASWLADYEAELCSFPLSAHDDQVDSTSQFLNWVKSRARVQPGLRGV